MPLEYDMPMEICMHHRFLPSSDIVRRDFDGEVMIIPLTADVGEQPNEIYTLNTTGRAIWDLLDGHHTIEDIAQALTCRFTASRDTILVEVRGFLAELLRRRIVVAVD